MKFPVIMALVSIFVLSSCGDSPVQYSQNIIFPAKNVSYINHVNPFLKVNCAYAGCHGTGYYTPYLDDYYSMINSIGLIIPGNPGGSKLIQIIEDTLPHPVIYYRAGITANHKTGMRQWVKEGALNN